MRGYGKSLLCLLQVFLFLALVTPILAQECSSSKPCEQGCCSRFGFCGYGKDFCSEDECVKNCDRKSECDPGDFGREFVELDACPLNICCSKHGWCGTGEEHCGEDFEMPKPKECTGRKAFNRVVGYYESWAMGRPCNVFNPELIPVGVYTHINFAFATIDPETFEVRPETAADVQLYKRLIGMKKRDPNVKILIALGGWTFNDPGPTQYVFSDIARSEENQEKFLKSLVSFMSTYGFDGLDLDWEYPVAKDRSGRDEDFKNFPKLLKKIKKSLKASGRDELSITIPASLWYLKHFDIQAMEEDIDFFNIMSYDLHGTWDLTNKWVGPYLNAHTNLTEIDSALDLLWLNDISPDKIVMGLAFYGRSFRMENPSCSEPGCRYGSGSAKNACSQEAGIILNSEIEDYLEESGASTTLHEDAAVKVLTYNDVNWVAYDDEDTLELKTDFAHKRCLGGVMVWAVSHDTRDAKFSKALGRHAPQMSPGGIFVEEGDDGYTEVEVITNYDQCMWTNCGQGCPSGYTTIKRYDDGARDGEIMMDGQGCDGHGDHVLCCPAGNGIPTCGWYKHRNGDCTPSCPNEMIEIGGNNQHCYRTGVAGFRSYQAACCTTRVGVGSHRVQFDNMKLYSQCEWGEWPYCDGECNNSRAGDLVALSYQGSGASQCWGGERSYCCGHDDEDWQWESCDWYKTYGDGASGSKDCKPGCPAGKVRVAMDGTDCKNGASAYCCNPKARTVEIEKREDPMTQIYREALEDFVDSPTCPAGYLDESVLEPRGLVYRSVLTRGTEQMLNGSDNFSRLNRRATTTELVAVREIAEEFYGYEGMDSVHVDLWNDIIAVVWEHLTVENIAGWLATDPGDMVLQVGIVQTIDYILCNIDVMNIVIGGGSGDDSEDIACTAVHLCTIENQGSLEKRDRPLDWEVRINGVTITGTIHFRPYPSAGDWNPYDDVQHNIYTEVFVFPNGGGCTIFVIETVNMLDSARAGTLTRVATEHLIELQTMPAWFQGAMQGLLANGDPATNTVDSSFFTNTLQDTNVLGQINRINPLRVPQGYEGGVLNINTIEERLMNALGSTRNFGVFVLADVNLNCYKRILWGNDNRYNTNPVGRQTMRALMNRDINNAATALTYMRDVINVFYYLNHAVVHGSMRSIMMEFRRELRVAERAHLHLTGNSVPLMASFDEFMPSFYARVAGNMRTFVNRWVTELQGVWDDPNDTQDIIVLALAATIQARAASTSIDETDFYGNV